MTNEEIKNHLIEMGRAAGAVAIGVAGAGRVDEEVCLAYERFLCEKRHFSMGYLENYREIRFNPLNLFTPPADTGSVVSFAFPYYHEGTNPLFARYAQGEDYHKSLRRRLKPLARYITEATGCRARICVDTAPILERYWAVQAGIGFIGRNHCLIVPGTGSYIFLAEIVTELPLPHDHPCKESCRDCGRCTDACPGGALRSPEFDCSLCLSCLTIEHRGPLSHPLPGRCIYGCDVCQAVCPHNAVPAPGLPEFRPTDKISGLTPLGIRHLSEEDYSAIFKSSAITRFPLPRLLRNLDMLQYSR